MPELPEVEASRLKIEKYCLNKEITDILVHERGGHAREGDFDDIVIDDSLRKPQKFIGRILIRTYRKGKYMVWELGEGHNLLFHFGMTGNFRIKGDDSYITYRSSPFSEGKGNDESELEKEQESIWPPKFTKLTFIFGDEVEVAFTDPRRLGRVKIRYHPLREEPLSELAADPFLEMPERKDFESLVRGSGNRAIKSILLDQTAIVCGIGNYLADECLHKAEIHPATRAQLLSAAEIEKLRLSILSICGIACKCLVENLEFPQDWLFHLRWNTKARNKRQKLAVVNEIKIRGRTTLFDPNVQRLRKNVRKAEISESSIEKEAKTEDGDGS